VPSAYGDVPERGRQVCLAHPDRTQQQSPVGSVEKPQGGQLGPELLVIAQGRGGVPGLQAHPGVEAGGAGAQRGGVGVAAGDLLSEHEFGEVGVG
jgi:hypothetical protein